MVVLGYFVACGLVPARHLPEMLCNAKRAANYKIISTSL
jgi:hypothetical protein